MITRRTCLATSVSAAMLPALARAAPADFVPPTPELERRLGAGYQAEWDKVRGLAPTLESRAVEAYLAGIGARLTTHLRRPFPYRYRFDFHPEFKSATAMPGGFVIVGGGTLAMADSEDAIAAVIGHEIMHVDLGHTTGRMPEALGWHKLSHNELDKLSAFDFGRTFSHEQELAADREGVIAAVAGGYSPYGMRRLFELYQYIGRNDPPRPNALTIETRVAQLDGLIRDRGWASLARAKKPLNLPFGPADPLRSK